MSEELTKDELITLAADDILERRKLIQDVEYFYTLANSLKLNRETMIHFEDKVKLKIDGLDKSISKHKKLLRTYD